jgi:type III restriction enzyme
MTKPFYAQPILNSPYFPPSRHHALNENGQPTELDPLSGRRRSKYVTPVPQSRKAKRGEPAQDELGFGDRDIRGQAYDPSPIVNELRGHLQTWRAIPNAADWSVTPTTQRLLQHWRSYEFQNQRPFFCQIEAVETIIWLLEVARSRKQYAHIFRYLEKANPEIFRLAMKLATGAGKTTVMAMLIAWQSINAARQPNSKLFSRGFLIIAPGITIRDRLRVLMPSDSDSYYRSRELVPPEMSNDLNKAKIVITNYHAFQQRNAMDINKVSEAALSGWRKEPIRKLETEGEMLQRACGELLSMKNVIVINDEAHHCYRERADNEEASGLKGDDKAEAKENNEAARLWISGIEALKRKVGIGAVLDLSATPFFLRGSGYAEGTLFPWVVSDFNLVDAIESGIVKLPRVPVADNAVNADEPVYRNLWDNVGKNLPKKGAGKSGDLDPLQLPPQLQTALYSLYSHYTKEFEAWERAGIGVPPVFIVVCNNTSTSKLVYEWVSGWNREEEGEDRNIHRGHLSLFSNYDSHGNRIGRMNTLLIDSAQIESGDALDPEFRKIAEPEIEAFKREKAEREGAGSVSDVTDGELLREVMNTVGQKGRIGEHVRCVVSVSMLTEGWDANTVTHILGVRAFGTQLLCEQVIGRGLRRQSYELTDETDINGNPLFGTEYADILGIPFDFATEPVNVTKTPPKPVTRIHAVRGREALSIRFPRVAGYRRDIAPDRISAKFSDNSKMVLTPELVGPCKVLMAGIVGEDHEITPQVFEGMRAASIATHLSKRVIELYFRDGDERPPYHLYSQVQAVTRRWVCEYLSVTGNAELGMVLYLELADKACALIHAAMAHESNDGTEAPVKAMLDPYNPAGVTDFVQFITTKSKLWATAPDRCKVNYVVGDSDWELEFARVVESHPATLAYVKNQGLGLEVPYLRDGAGGEKRRYVPDFIVRIDDGRGADDPLHLIVEIKGFKDLDAQIKAETMKAYWVPGVNNLKTFGRWAFAEFRDAFALEEEWGRLMAEVCKSRHLKT